LSFVLYTCELEAGRIGYLLLPWRRSPAHWPSAMFINTDCRLRTRADRACDASGRRNLLIFRGITSSSVDENESRWSIVENASVDGGFSTINRASGVSNVVVWRRDVPRRRQLTVAPSPPPPPPSVKFVWNEVEIPTRLIKASIVVLLTVDRNENTTPRSLARRRPERRLGGGRLFAI